jgi:hypothetical protein
VESIVETLVDGGLDPSVLLTEVADLRHLPCLIIADTVPLEGTLLIELIDCTKSVRKRYRSIRSMKIPSCDLIDPQCIKTPTQAFTEIVWAVVVKLIR